MNDIKNALVVTAFKCFVLNLSVNWIASDVRNDTTIKVHNEAWFDGPARVRRFTKASP